LQKLGVSVFAASVDSGEDAEKVANELSFGIGVAVDRNTADRLGAWWEDRRAIIQPTQFLMRRDGTIVQSTYSDGPLGRIDAGDVCALVNFLTKK
jgi:peroxiredoxin